MRERVSKAIQLLAIADLAAVLLQRSVVSTAEPERPEPIAVGVCKVVSTVADLDRSIAFYTTVLDFSLIPPAADAGAEPGDPAILSASLALGDKTISLRQFVRGRGKPYPVGSRSNDGWFQHLAIVVSDMDRAYERLHAANVTHISSGPQTLPDWNVAAAGIKAFYFRDPDGHPLELIWYPAGKGQDKWHEHTERLFLGIDHTAIAIADTEASLRFYGDGLGFRIVGQSENLGSEQERLNGLIGSRVRITSLRGDFGPGIQFLEYLAPADGRPMPVDSIPNDAIYRETCISGVHPTAVEDSREDTVLRDPDQHRLRVLRK
jgi:catechol 2,3-dioxygenase-like lactoylglutathione lyase family enzyme